MSPYMDKRRELGIWLKVLLAKYGIRQTQIASKLGITRQYVCQICGGKSPLAPEHFKTIYDMLLEMQAAESDRKSTRLNSSHITRSRMPSSA